MTSEMLSDGIKIFSKKIPTKQFPGQEKKPFIQTMKSTKIEKSKRDIIHYMDK